jgi:competence protein ComEC
MDYKAGMFVYALAFLLGIVLLQQCSELPEISQLVVFLIAASAFYLVLYQVVLRYFSHNRKGSGYTEYLTLTIIIILLIIIGILYSSIYAKWQLSYLLEEAFSGQNIVISGRISSVPVISGDVQRFVFDVDSHRILDRHGQSRKETRFPGKIRLSWYYGQPVNAGEKWQLQVRLKPPHGFMNPGGFDYEAWLFQQAIQATGYVRKSELNQRKRAASWWSINSIRQSLGEKIDDIVRKKRNTDNNGTSASSLSLVKALAIGDKSSISTQQWRVLANTGTSHLMAISGLHIGLAALFTYVLIRRLTPVFIMKRIPAQHVALIASILVAMLYALIAGLSIPTQRAIMMLSVLSVMIIIRRNSRPVDSLGFALLTVLLIDPLAVLSAGFWFSFSAVAVIFVSLTAAQKQKSLQPSFFARLYSILKQWVRLQLAISIFLLPLSLFMFQQASLISPLANLLLIPYVSFLVVPVVLVAIFFSFLLPDAADLLFNFSAMLLDFIWPVLSFLSAQPYAFWIKGDVGIIELLLATAAMLLIFFSRQIFSKQWLSFPVINAVNKQHQGTINNVALWLFRIIASLLIIPLFMANTQTIRAGEYQLTILDVGQGSAAVIKTQNHTVVFDAGAIFSDKMNAGSSVVIPYLRSQGIRKLDRLIISHGDSDHIGGAQVILDSYPESDVIGQDIENLVTGNKRENAKQHCEQGIQWQWDGVDFEFISPDIKNISQLQAEKRNNRSCVLRVSSQSGSVLFTGDIEKKIEYQLLKKYADKLPSDILIVPHHASNTSSSQEFIQAVKPKISVISVGYRNRYMLPSSRVISRYEALNRELIQTDKSGAVTIRMSLIDGILVEQYREKARKYWHHKLK